MGEVDGEKKKVRLGRWEDVPRALSFTLSPASKLPARPSAKEASAEERVSVRTSFPFRALSEANRKRQCERRAKRTATERLGRSLAGRFARRSAHRLWHPLKKQGTLAF